MDRAFGSLLTFSLLRWVFLSRVELQCSAVVHGKSLGSLVDAIRTCEILHLVARDTDNRVRSLHMNPTDDTFISAGDDGTVRVWDLRMPECKVSCVLRMIITFFAAYDATHG